jgi:hypothetical protein
MGVSVHVVTSGFCPRIDVYVPSVDVLGHTALKNNAKVAARRTATTATRTARKVHHVVVNDNVVRAMSAMIA